jgi:hypothetical protein
VQNPHPHTPCGDECVDVGWVDVDMLADLMNGDSAFGDEPADEPGRGAQSLGGLFDVERRIGCIAVSPEHRLSALGRTPFAVWGLPRMPAAYVQ